MLEFSLNFFVCHIPYRDLHTYTYALEIPHDIVLYKDLECSYPVLAIAVFIMFLYEEVSVCIHDDTLNRFVDESYFFDDVL